MTNAMPAFAFAMLFRSLTSSIAAADRTEASSALMSTELAQSKRA